MRFPVALYGALFVALAGSGCGGGSPSDIVLPQDVDVTVIPAGEPGAHGVTLELGAANGRDVDIRLSGLDLEDATGLAFELSFDPALLEFTDATNGAFFGPAAAAGADVVEGAPGRLVGVAALHDQSQGRSGSGQILTLRFQLRQLRDADTQLIFAVPASLVYSPAGVAGQHVFTSAQLVTRIRAPQ